MPKLESVKKLLEILVRRDDDLVPKFYQALVGNDQKHVACILGYKGLHTFVTISRPIIAGKVFFVCSMPW